MFVFLSSTALLSSYFTEKTLDKPTVKVGASV